MTESLGLSRSSSGLMARARGQACLSLAKSRFIGHTSIVDRLSYHLLILVFSLVSCGPTYNSSSSDKARFGSVTGSVTFLAASNLMKNQCSQCHQEYAGMSEADFVAVGLVVPASLSGSRLFTKIRGNTTNISGNMPLDTTLSADDIQVMQDWINSISL